MNNISIVNTMQAINSSQNTKINILIYDSGVGGITIFKEIEKLNLNLNIIYCLDNKFFPYSEKTENQIKQRALKISHKINNLHKLDLIVVACNTASTVVLPILRENFNIPIVGTVPAIKPACSFTNTKKIGLLATKGTIKRQYVDELIKDYAKDITVEKIGTTKLVEIAERKFFSNIVDLNEIYQEVKPWQKQNIDTIVLGCTHFPLLEKELSILLPQVQKFINSGEAIAKRVNSLLESKTISKINHTNKKEDKNYILYFTKKPQNILELEKMLIKLGFNKFILLD